MLLMRTHYGTPTDSTIEYYLWDFKPFNGLVYFSIDGQEMNCNERSRQWMDRWMYGDKARYHPLENQ